MKKNIYILIAVAVLAALALILILSRTTTTLQSESSDFALNDTSNVTRIFMSDKNNNTLTLTRKDAKNWVVNDKYVASPFNISMLLQTMLEIEVSMPVAKAARNNIIRQMAANSVKVEVYQEVYRINLFKKIRLFRHEKLTKVYYVGGATPNNRGSYFLMDGSEEPFVVILPGLRGFVTPRYMPIEKYWRDYTVLKRTLPQIRTVIMEVPGAPQESFMIENSVRSFALLDYPGRSPVQGPVDTVAIMNFLNGFRNLNFEVLLNDLEKVRKDSILSLPPFINITVTDTAGETRVIHTFRRPADPGATDMNGKPLPYDMDRFYALINNDQDLVLAQFFVFDKVMRPKSYFLVNKKGNTPGY
jgi:hypothetical protein